MADRSNFTVKCWEYADWAIPPLTHPLESPNWDVPNCAGNWQPPTPDQVRSYIAQAIHRYQQQEESRLLQVIKDSTEKLRAAMLKSATTDDGAKVG